MTVIWEALGISLPLALAVQSGATSDLLVTVLLQGGILPAADRAAAQSQERDRHRTFCVRTGHYLGRIHGPACCCQVTGNIWTHQTTFPSLEGFPKIELQWLLDHGQTLDLAKGDFLMCEGDPAPRFYITLAGELQITRTINGREVVRGTTPPGIMAGEIWLLYNTLRLSPRHSARPRVGFRPPNLPPLSRPAL